jgi:ABC-type thiamin/hydroxymethylpyrimidine transport system permease subunit
VGGRTKLGGNVLAGDALSVVDGAGGAIIAEELAAVFSDIVGGTYGVPSLMLCQGMMSPAFALFQAFSTSNACWIMGVIPAVCDNTFCQ